MAHVVSIDTMRAERRTRTTDEQIAYVGLDGRPHYVNKRIVAGEMEIIELARPIGEMITSEQGAGAVVQKVVIDLELGREQLPLLYGPIYRRMENPDFSEFVDVTGLTNAEVVFLEKLELEEVKFGARRTGPRDSVPIITYAAGFQWTEDMIVYNKSWQIEEANRALGEAYNALLNHIHLYPIISYSYASKNQTPADATAGATTREKIRNTIRQGLIDSQEDQDTDTLTTRNPTILLAHGSRRWDIEEAIQRFSIGGTDYPALAEIQTLIFYNGHSLRVAEKTYTYSGVATNKAYLIEPQTRFRELVKHDLRIDAGNADISRLIEQQIVARARRGVLASPANAVQELTLP